MKKKTNKQQLVDRMIAKGNNYGYVEMIKELLKITRGEKYQYNWKYDRGYYATNFSLGSNGYMVTGVGDCGVYKGEDGKWHAKYYSKEEKLTALIEKKIKTIVGYTLASRNQYEFERRAWESEQKARGVDPYVGYYNSELACIQRNHRYRLQEFKTSATKDIVKAIAKIN
jgi:hypothetical protein